MAIDGYRKWVVLLLWYISWQLWLVAKRYKILYPGSWRFELHGPRRHGSYKLNHRGSVGAPHLNHSKPKLPFLSHKPPRRTRTYRCPFHTRSKQRHVVGVQLGQGLVDVVPVDEAAEQAVRARPGGVRHGHPGPVAQRGALHGGHHVCGGGAPPLPAARRGRRADRVRRSALPLLVRRRPAAASRYVTACPLVNLFALIQFGYFGSS